MPSPDSGAALKALARAVDLQQRGRLDEAEAVYASVLTVNPDDATVLINAGALALARRDVARALARLEKAIDIVPANTIALANFGFALVSAAMSIFRQQRFGDWSAPTAAVARALRERFGWRNLSSERVWRPLQNPTRIFRPQSFFASMSSGSR